MSDGELVAFSLMVVFWILFFAYDYVVEKKVSKLEERIDDLNHSIYCINCKLQNSLTRFFK